MSEESHAQDHQNSRHYRHHYSQFTAGQRRGSRCHAGRSRPCRAGCGSGGAGARSVLPSYSGLQREFPSQNEPADNPTTPEKVELGRQLFFDPVLSAENDTSCATCHHPDLGFSNGEPVSNPRRRRKS